MALSPSISDLPAGSTYKIVAETAFEAATETENSMKKFRDAVKKGDEKDVQIANTEMQQSVRVQEMANKMVELLHSMIMRMIQSLRVN